MKNIEIVAQFIPILIIFLLLKYSNDFVKFSFTVLGKLIALLIIIFYTNIDITIGLCICGLVILYYQSDYVENMLNIDEILTFDELPNIELDEINIDTQFKVDDVVNLEYDGLYLLPIGKNATKKTTFTKERNRREKKEKGKRKEKMTVYEESKNEFRKQNCTRDGGKNILKYKGNPIKNEMIEHVFPEIKFNSLPCNPCSTSCGFSIIEEKLRTEESMIPISTME